MELARIARCPRCGAPAGEYEQKIRILDNGDIEEDFSCIDCNFSATEITPLLKDLTGEEPLEELLSFLHD